jgi:hypothetical protein
MRRTVVVWLLALLPLLGAAQQMVPYDLDFNFNDGIYLSFADFKTNNPIPVTYIISEHDIRLPDYMELVTEAEMVRYYNDLGEERSVKTSALWGYSFGGKAFIRHGDGFFRMPIFGAIAHFTAVVTVYQTVSDPMMMNPGMMPYREVPVQELRQFILDMRSGQVSPYTIDNTLALMPADRDLVDEFLKLKKKQQQEGLLLLIRKFNDRYPVYFPE